MTAAARRAASSTPRETGRGATRKRAATGPARRERLDTAERRDQLLAVAKELFMDRPYDEVSMDDLSTRAGVSKGLVFHYFGSKKELYVELVRKGSEELLAATLTPDAMSPLDRLQTGLLAYLQHVEANGKAWVTLFTSGVGVDPEISAIVDKTRATLAERIVRNLPGSSPRIELAARGFIGFVEATTLAWLQVRQQKPEDLVRLFMKVLAAALTG